jgi:opacity protein-like surface antigen
MTSSHGRAARPALARLGLALLVLSASAAHAQTAAGPARAVSFGVSGGLGIPTGDAGDVFASGFNVDALVEVQARPASPLAFRFEAGYQRLELKDDIRDLFEELGGDIDVNARIFSGLANVLYKFPGTTVRPYVLGGVGVFNLGGSASISGFEEFEEELDTEESGSTTSFGYNVGGGLEVPLSGITVFGDVRFQQIRIDGSGFNIVPIKVGIRF